MKQSKKEPRGRRIMRGATSVFAAAFITIVALTMMPMAAIASVSLLNDGAGSELGRIVIHSQIRKGDFAAFLRAADRIKKVTRITANGVPFIIVELDSPGGDLTTAVDIGRIIHERFMMTVVGPHRECASACVFILIAGAMRAPTYSARIGLHRPTFDPAFFAKLSPEQARAKYDALVGELRKYFFEMGGSPSAFQIMLSTPSDRVYFLTKEEVDRFGFRGEDPAWGELNNAKMIERYGAQRWPMIKHCAERTGDINACAQRAYERYPKD